MWHRRLCLQELVVLQWYGCVFSCAIYIGKVEVAVAAGVAGGGVKSMLSSCPGGGGGGSAQRRGVALSDGTQIEEDGINWKEVGGFGAYKENFDGAFSKTS